MKDFAKRSKANNLPRTNIIGPHIRKTKTGYKLIKPYPRYYQKLWILE